MFLPGAGGIFGGLGRLLKRPVPLRQRVCHEFSHAEFTETEFTPLPSEPLPEWDGVAVPLEELLDQSEARIAARRASPQAATAGTPENASASAPHPGSTTTPAPDKEDDITFQPLRMPAPGPRRRRFGRRRSSC